MKKIAITLISIGFVLTLFAQQAPPQGINYQAVVYVPYGNQQVGVNSVGQIPANKKQVVVKYTLEEGNNGPVIYEETQIDTTDQYGLLNTVIGTGTPTSISPGLFNQIDWGLGDPYLRVSITLPQYNSTVSSYQKLWSVPYSLNSGRSNFSDSSSYAEFAGNGLTNGTTVNQIMYWNGTSWVALNPGTNGQVLAICNDNLTWVTMYGICSGLITELNCENVTNIGTLTSGTPASGVSSSIPYLGGNGGAHNGQTVSSTGVIGLTATLVAGSFAIGNGSLSYTISGTPSTTGIASFILNIGGQSCILNLTVSPDLTPVLISTNNCSSLNGINSSYTYWTGTVYTTTPWLVFNNGFLNEYIKADNPSLTGTDALGGFIEFQYTFTNNGFIKLWVKTPNPGSNNIIPQLYIDGVLQTTPQIIGGSISSFDWMQIQTVNIPAGAHTIKFLWPQVSQFYYYSVDEIEFWEYP